MYVHETIVLDDERRILKRTCVPGLERQLAHTQHQDLATLTRAEDQQRLVASLEESAPVAQTFPLQSTQGPHPARLIPLVSVPEVPGQRTFGIKWLGTSFRKEFPGELLDHFDTAVAILDEVGNIEQINQAWRDQIDAVSDADQRERLRSYSSYVEGCRRSETPPFTTAALAGLEEVLSGTRSFYEAEYSSRNRDERNWYRVLITALDAGGASVIHVNSSRGRLMNEARTQLANIVESSKDAILSQDLEGTVLSWNRTAEELYGYPAAEMIGRSVKRIVPEDRLPEWHEIMADIREGKRVESLDTRRVRRNGEVLEISLTLSPLRDTDGVLLGISTIERDVTEQRRIERSIERQRDLLETINRINMQIASMLHSDALAGAAIEAALRFTSADIGVFFYQRDEHGRFSLYELSGLKEKAIESFELPADTPLFREILVDKQIVRLADVSFGKGGLPARQYGLPLHECTIRSFMAVPVVGRSGDLLGAMLFGHEQSKVFAAEDEQFAAAIAAQAAVAIRTQCCIRTSSPSWLNDAGPKRPCGRPRKPQSEPIAHAESSWRAFPTSCALR